MKQTSIVDNRDGSPADVTVEMTYEGQYLTWDLSNANKEKLDKALKPWLECAEVVRDSSKRTKRSKSAKSVKSAKSATNGQRHSDPADVRAWAREAGFEMAPAGRIRADVQAAYDEAHA